MDSGGQDPRGVALTAHVGGGVLIKLTDVALPRRCDGLPLFDRKFASDAMVSWCGGDWHRTNRPGLICRIYVWVATGPAHRHSMWWVMLL